MQIKIASRQIVIVSEKDDIPSEFEKALRLMMKAERIYFLGFGYNDVNLQRLKIEQIKNKIILGTCYGLGKAEMRSIKGKWRNIRLANNTYKTLDFFRNVAPLF